MSDAHILTLEQDMAGATAVHTARQIGEALEAEYPGWMWFVEVAGGVAKIRTMHANPRYGFNLNLVSDHYSASDLKRQAVTAGGELLERLGMPRSRVDYDRMQSRPVDAHGFLHYAN